MKKHLLLLLLLCGTLFNNAVLAQKKSGTKKTTAPKVKPATTTPTEEPQQEQIKPSVGDPSKENVAIYPFTSASGYDYEYAQSVGNAVESGFVRSSRFNVVERNRFGAIKQEERFKEVNTDNIVKLAAKFGAKYIITGHITGVNSTAVYSSYDHKLTGYQTSISLAFKIIDVETSLIKATEAINITGSGDNTAASKGNAYATIDGITRRLIAANFPQRFKFMSTVLVETKKKQQVLSAFKIWAGSDNGLKPGDVVELYYLTYVVNPSTGKKIEERNNIGIATVVAVSSGSTSVCQTYKPQKYGAALLDAITKTPELVSIEYAGGSKPRGFFDF